MAGWLDCLRYLCYGKYMIINALILIWWLSMKRIISLRIFCTLAFLSMLAGDIHAKPMPQGKDKRSLINTFLIANGALYSVAAAGSAGIGYLCKAGGEADKSKGWFILSAFFGIPGAFILSCAGADEIMNHYNFESILYK